MRDKRAGRKHARRCQVPRRPRRTADFHHSQALRSTVSNPSDTQTLYSQGRPAFTEVELVARGATFDIVRARDIASDRYVALRALRGKDDPTTLLQRVVEAGGALSPDAPPRIEAVSSTPGGPAGEVVLTPWIDGRSLREVARTDSISIEHGLAIARDIAEAIARLNDNNYVLRALRPDRILVDEEGRAHVIELAAALPKNARPDDPAEVEQVWAAPEIAREASGMFITPRADVYSFGCTLAFIFSGEAPCESPESPITAEAWRSLAGVDEGVARLVAHMTQPMHKNRLASVGKYIAFLTPATLPQRESKGFGAISLAAPWTVINPRSSLSAGPLVTRPKTDAPVRETGAPSTRSSLNEAGTSTESAGVAEPDDAGALSAAESADAAGTAAPARPPRVLTAGLIALVLLGLAAAVMHLSRL